MDQLKSERIFNVYFKIITLLCVIYSFSQSAFARIMPYLDLAVSCCLILFWVITIIFNKALFTRLEILLLLAVVMFFPFMLVISSDVEYSIKRWFTLFCQLFCMYIFPISVYRGSRETVTIQADSSVKWIKRAISVIAIANVAIMLWGSITKNFVLYGFEIGNYISSRFSGFMTAPAAAGELSLVFLYAAYTAKDKSKFCRFAGILIFALTFWLTKARSMLIGGCIFFVIYYLLRKTKGRNTIFFLSCFAIVGALVLFGFVNGEDINEISSNRTEIWAYIISNGRGLLGNSLSSMAVEMNGELFEGGTHNSILQTAYMMGWPLTILMFSLFILRFVKYIKHMKLMSSNPDYQNEILVMLALAIGIFIQSMFEAHLVIVRTPISFLFFFLMFKLEVCTQGKSLNPKLE